MTRLEMMTSREFNPVLSDISDAVSAAGGWINDHQVFSSIMAMVAFEVPDGKFAHLIETLEKAKIKPMEPVKPVHPSGKDMAVRMTITFLNDGRDIKREVPAFG